MFEHFHAFSRMGIEVRAEAPALTVLAINRPYPLDQQKSVEQSFSPHPREASGRAIRGYPVSSFVVAILVGHVLTTSSLSAATAEWRYCFAPSDATRTIYLSDISLTSALVGTLEISFKQVLANSNIVYDTVQYPLARDKAGISASRDHAIRFSKEFFMRSAIELR